MNPLVHPVYYTLNLGKYSKQYDIQNEEWDSYEERKGIWGSIYRKKQGISNSLTVVGILIENGQKDLLRTSSKEIATRWLSTRLYIFFKWATKKKNRW